jgi:hypothetical protein
LGLVIDRTYITEEEKVEFAAFATPEDFVYVPRAPKIAAPAQTSAVRDVVISTASECQNANTFEAEEIKMSEHEEPAQLQKEKDVCA